ncbi:MAG: hypothetical protein IJV41_10990, partial [Oscillospiraceae bacterium]|nr:hypothetical protein [Oscillospiraceae bacterium]
MDMTRSFAYLMAAAVASLALCGCSNMTGNGNVAASPAPAIESPVIPSPDLDMDVSPMPDDRTATDRDGGNGMTGDNSNTLTDGVTDSNRGNTAASPRPSSAAK